MAFDPLRLARRLGERLAAVRGVESVVVGGSHARGTADAASDLDLGIYYRGAGGLDVSALRALAVDVDDRAADDPGSIEVTEIGGWGPRINGGAWLVVGGRRVDWIYREVESVAASIAAVRAGRSPLELQPGHPFGWQPQMDAGEVAAAIVLVDRQAAFDALRRAAVPYPRALQTTKVGELWEARFALDNATKPAERGDALTVMGHLYRSLMLGVQAIFAVNHQYLVNEKGSVAAAAAMPRTIPRLSQRTSEVAAGGGGVRSREPASLVRLLGLAGELLADIEHLAKSAR